MVVPPPPLADTVELGSPCSTNVLAVAPSVNVPLSGATVLIASTPVLETVSESTPFFCNCNRLPVAFVLFINTDELVVLSVCEVPTPSNTASPPPATQLMPVVQMV